MKLDHYPVLLKYSTTSISLFGEINDWEKKEGFDKKKTLYGETTMSYLSIGQYIDIEISYISETEFKKLKTLWINQNEIEVNSDRGNILFGTISNEDMNWKPKLNSVKNEYYYEGTLNLEV